MKSMMRIAIALLAIAIALAPDAIAQNALAGVFKGNAKQALLTQVTAFKGEQEPGKPVTVLVFTTDDQAKDPKAAFNALFRKYGDALVVKVRPDGSVYSTDIMHAGLNSPNGSITVFDVMQMRDFKIANGEVSGHLTTYGKREMSGQTWEVDLTFRARAP
jgi:hypothetical protein